jgi:multidrug efflux pump subunit AcrA (membrane-fusion protein)
LVKVFNKLVTIICLSALFVSGVSCASKASQPALEKQVATVQFGNVAVTVSVDGNLVMPQAYNLLFGAPGNVQDVFVEEGDFVKEGTVLATLDNATEKLGVQSANNSVQQVLSKLYETVPLQPQFPKNIVGPIGWNQVTPQPLDPITHLPLPEPVYQPVLPIQNIPLGPIVYYAIKAEDAVTHVPITVYVPHTKTIYTTFPSYYPSSAALVSFGWAQGEVTRAHGLFQSGNYTAAASELYVALSDLEACTAIFDDTINNPQSGLGNIAPLVTEDVTLTSIQLYNSFAVTFIKELHQLISSIKQAQADMEGIQELIAQEKYEEASPLFQPLLSQVNDIGKAVINDINEIKTYNFGTIYGEDLCLYFYGAANDKLNAALKGIETGGLKAPELHDNLRIADHYMQICNGILGSNDYVLQHGLSLKNEHQYDVDLQNALVGLGNAQDNFLKTVVLAPFDGTVVSVGVKKNDVLSAIDYASKTAVQLVDTSQIKFQGQVDEIDILKIKTGQKAVVSVDAVPNKTFTGTVSFISPYGSTDTGSVVKFNVTIKLDPTDVALKGGLTATADVVISSVENALLVPLSAVTTTSEGSFVNIINEATGQPEQRQVTLGSQNLQFAEVLSGLKEGDKVIVQEKVTGAPVVTGFPRGGGGPPPGRD